MSSLTASPRLFAVLPTFRRLGALRQCLDAVVMQTRRPDRLLVVDNDPSDDVAAAVENYRRTVIPSGADAEYLAAPANLGPAGAVCVGMTWAVGAGSDADWVVQLEDDDPPPDPGALHGLLATGTAVATMDPMLAGVGLRGGRFDGHRGRVLPIAPSAQELTAADYLGGGWCPMYRLAVIRHVGTYDPNLFFGFEELEFGLRLRRAGYTLYSRELGRQAASRSTHPGLRLRAGGWRRYYALRNLTVILRRDGHPVTAARMGVTRGLLKPLANLPLAPREACTEIVRGTRALRDGWTDHLGRTLEPDGFVAHEAQP